MLKKHFSIILSIMITVMSLFPISVNAVVNDNIKNDYIINYEYNGNTVKATLSVEGNVRLGGFEATLGYDSSKYNVIAHNNDDPNILLNVNQDKGEIFVSMATTDKNIESASDLFNVEFDSPNNPSPSDFTFDVSYAYMLDDNLNVVYTDFNIKEKWNGIERTTTTAASDTNTTTTTSTTVSTSEANTTTTTVINNTAPDNHFVVSVNESKDKNNIEVSLMVEGNVGFWTAEGKIKMDSTGLGEPSFVSSISDATTSYIASDKSIYFYIISSSGKNIEKGGTIFTYCIPITDSKYDISCEGIISDICDQNYNDANYTIQVRNGDSITTTTDSTTSTTSTTTTTSTSNSTTSTTSTTSATTESTTSTTTTSSTTDTTTTSTFTTSATETSSTTTEPVTTTEEATISASPYEMSNWAENDYYKKTGVEPYASTYTENDDGTLTITLLDEDGNVLDKYTVHSKTGIGFDSSGEEVNLPQTGNNSMKNWLIVFGALMLIGLGVVSVKTSRVSFR